MKRATRISTVFELLTETGARLLLYDMGRHLTRIPGKRFLSFEKNQTPYPTPLRQQAWFAMLFQAQGAAEPFVWFLRFPLDEQAKLNQAARDDFMHRLVERVGANLKAAGEGSGMEAALQDNPYSFKPRDDRLASFHARVSRRLNESPSRHYAHARDYFSGALGWDQWPFIGYQGIADLAARFDQDDNEQLLIDALPQLPIRPLEAICHCLENERIGVGLSQALCDISLSHLQQGEPATTVAATIRAISRSRSQTLREQLLRAVLDDEASNDAEVLAAIGARAWVTLPEADLAQPFLERLALNSQGGDFFNQCLADLLYIPGMREPLLAGLRAPGRSEALSAAVGAFFQKLSGG